MKIVSVPGINALGKRGSEGAPDLLLEKGDKVPTHHTHSEALSNGNKILDVDEVLIDNDNVQESQEKIYQKARELFVSKEKIVFLGGDHSISYPLLKGFSEVYGRENFLIVFDAHADCMPCMREPTHEEWLRGVIESGFVKGENIVVIGCRKIENVERKFLIENGVRFYSDSDWELVSDGIMEKARGKKVYVSIDVDVFEPCVAPGVSYAEPCGLNSGEFFYLLNRFLHLDVVGVDLVEIVPEIDKKYDYRTVKLGKKILERILRK